MSNIDKLIDAYIESLPKGLKEREVAVRFTGLQTFCHWFLTAYGRHPDLDDFTGPDYRTIRTLYIESHSNGDRKEIQYHFRTIVIVDLFTEWLTARTA